MKWKVLCGSKGFVLQDQEGKALVLFTSITNKNLTQPKKLFLLGNGKYLVEAKAVGSKTKKGRVVRAEFLIFKTFKATSKNF